MSPLPPQDYLSWQVCTTLLHVLAIASGLFRLKQRFSADQMWWDDWIVSIPLSTDAIYVIFVWLRFRAKERVLSPVDQTKAIHSYWLSTFLYFTVIWFSRISIALSIARIYPAGDPHRRFSIFLITLFIILYITSTIVAILTCPSPYAWYHLDISRCLKEKNIGWAAVVTTFSFDCFSDVSLVITPLAFLRNTDLPLRERRAIISAFCASVLTFLAAITFSIFWLAGLDLGLDTRLLRTMVGYTEAGVSLLVCNFLVVSMTIYRLFKRSSGPNTTSSSSPTDETHQNRRRLTRVTTPSQNAPTSGGETAPSAGMSMVSRDGARTLSTSQYISPLTTVYTYDMGTSTQMGSRLTTPLSHLSAPSGTGTGSSTSAPLSSPADVKLETHSESPCEKPGDD